MSKIFHNKTCPFRFWDWRFKSVKHIYAGRSCVMAITDKGEVLQKVTDEALAAQTEYWKNVKSISISQLFPALAVGLVNDGTCMISKKALRYCCSITGQSFDYINEQVESLKHIVKIAVSDAVFALDSFGMVHHIPLWKNDVYTEVNNWQDIVHIAVGSQDSVFGITRNGSVVCTGGNCTNGPFGNMQNKLSAYQNVIDICAMGSECEHVMLALSDGRLINFNGNDMNAVHCGKNPVFHGNFLFSAIRLNGNALRCKMYGYYGCEEVVRIIETTSIREIAAGVYDSSCVFAVWL